MLVQALAKGDRGELAVELAVELGVDEVVPWAAARSVVRWDGGRGQRSLERWRSTARAAAKQSRRAWLPAVAEPAVAPGTVAGLIGGGGRGAGAARGGGRAAGLGTAAGRAATSCSSSVPRAVWTTPSWPRSPAAGATAVRLGAPVLRTSTAGAAALAALSLRTGRWD